jgi:hypothetical protein
LRRFRKLATISNPESAMNFAKTPKHCGGHPNSDRLSDADDHSIDKGERPGGRSRLAPPLAGLNERRRAGMGRVRKT